MTTYRLIQQDHTTSITTQLYISRYNDTLTSPFTASTSHLRYLGRHLAAFLRHRTDQDPAKLVSQISESGLHFHSPASRKCSQLGYTIHQKIPLRSKLRFSIKDRRVTRREVLKTHTPFISWENILSLLSRTSTTNSNASPSKLLPQPENPNQHKHELCTETRACSGIDWSFKRVFPYRYACRGLFTARNS